MPSDYIVVTLDSSELLDFCGPNDSNIRHLEKKFGFRIVTRGNKLLVPKNAPRAEDALAVIQSILEVQRKRGRITTTQFRQALTRAVARIEEEAAEPEAEAPESAAEAPAKSAKRERDILVDHLGPDVPMVLQRSKTILSLTDAQRKYLSTIREHDITFAIGPAGTGKTYLAVAMAVDYLLRGEVSRIILCRPAVEAGEKLGFLPGDLSQKLDPYVRPLWDALYEMLEVDKTKDFFEKGIIEIAPLAFMRGRTLNKAFVILDEGQNTSSEQMKMFLTRLGNGSKMVITGDITQIDLPQSQRSGLIQVRKVLAETPGIGFASFTQRDVKRNELVMRVVKAYEAWEAGLTEDPSGKHRL
ncbi:MAG: PhoH family protein [Candidatus Sumerlaeia bacterium]|nr:PhoH family protein [Candidatus Sumerlaeia bacterium]